MSSELGQQDNIPPQSNKNEKVRKAPKAFDQDQDIGNDAENPKEQKGQDGKQAKNDQRGARRKSRSKSGNPIRLMNYS